MRKVVSAQTTTTHDEVGKLLQVPISLPERTLDRDGSAKSGQRYSEVRWKRSVHSSAGTRHIIHQAQVFNAIAIDHNTLIDHFRTVFGIHDVALDWLPSFVTEHNQHIAVGSEKSAIFASVYGIPQGSVLRLMHFGRPTCTCLQLAMSYLSTTFITISM